MHFAFEALQQRERRLRGRQAQQPEFVENVLDLRNQLGALLQQPVGEAARLCENAPRHREYLTPLVQRAIRGDHGVAAVAPLDHDDAKAQPT